MNQVFGRTFTTASAMVCMLCMPVFAAEPAASKATSVQSKARAPAQAAATQRVGPVYSISEQDMLEHIQDRLESMRKDGSLQQFQDQAIARSKASIEAPKGVQLPRTQQDRRWLVDPTYVVPQDYADHRGQVFARAGERINPLERGTRLTKPLLFADGNDDVQVAAAAKLLQKWPTAKLILTDGRWQSVSERLKVRVFFDQGSRLVRTFGITAVPAMVSQHNNMLEVHELVP
jgi:conjugal transfer pilus assembly protein TraW